MQGIKEVNTPEEAEAWQDLYYQTIVQLKLVICMWNFLMVQELTLGAYTARAWFQSLVEELKSH